MVVLSFRRDKELISLPRFMIFRFIDKFTERYIMRN